MSPNVIILGVHVERHLEYYFKLLTVFVRDLVHGAPLGHSNAILGASWEHIGSILEHIGAYWCIVRQSCGQFGVFSGHVGLLVKLGTSSQKDHRAFGAIYDS